MLSGYSIRRDKAMIFNGENMADLQDVVKEDETRVHLDSEASMDKWWVAGLIVYGFDSQGPDQNASRHTEYHQGLLGTCNQSSR
jgi:hypothetical protein